MMKGLVRQMVRDPYIFVEYRINEQYHGGNYRQSRLPELMATLRSNEVDVVYLDYVETTVSAWVSTHGSR